MDVCGQRRAEPGNVAAIRDPSASVRVDAELYQRDGVSLGWLHMRGSAHPKRRFGACPRLDGLTASFDGVAFGRVVFGAADGEALTSRLLAGFVLIFLSIILSETHFDFLRKKPRPQL